MASGQKDCPEAVYGKSLLALVAGQKSFSLSRHVACSFFRPALRAGGPPGGVGWCRRRAPSPVSPPSVAVPLGRSLGLLRGVGSRRTSVSKPETSGKSRKDFPDRDGQTAPFALYKILHDYNDKKKGGGNNGWNSGLSPFCQAHIYRIPTANPSGTTHVVRAQKLDSELTNPTPASNTGCHVIC